MAKEKVYKLAQEFKVSSEALVQMLRGMGIPVKSHMSTVDESLRTEIKKKFELERAEIKKEYERKKQMLTKAREDLIGEEPAEAPAPKAESLPAQAAEPPQTAGIIQKESLREIESTRPSARTEAAQNPSQRPQQFQRQGGGQGFGGQGQGYSSGQGQSQRPRPFW